MKNIQWIFLIVLNTCLGGSAQDYSYPLIGITKVVISSETVIILKSHKLPSLIIKESENLKNSKPDFAKGLKKLSGKGNDNTNFGIEIQKNESTLVLRGLRDRRASNMVIHLPKTMNISIESLANNEVYVNGFKADIEVINHHGGTILTDISGPVISENNNGNIKVSFSSLNQSYPISIIAENGDIEIGLPSTAAANVNVKTPRGDFYTDFDLIIDKSEHAKPYDKSIHGKINNGGVEINLQNLKGNIYLRQID